MPEEVNVRPGINQEFKSPTLELARWIKTFEGESREIYAHRDELVGALHLRKGMDVADVGAGTGLFTALFAGAVGPKGRVYAVDIAPVFLGHIAKRAGEAGLSNVVTVLATDRSSQLPANSVDRIFICDTYHHFEFPQSSLASLHAALRPRGELLLVDFKREPGISSDWVLKHVRAGQEVFTAELEKAGFRKVEELPLLKDNYVLRFRKHANGR